MSTITVPDIPLTNDSPAERLRQLAAAARVSFTWWGTHKTLTNQQKEEVCDAYGADARLLSAGKKIIDVRHEAFRRLTSIKSRIVNYWRGLTLPFVETGVRLIRQSDIPSFARVMEDFRRELHDAGITLNAAYDQMKSDARSRLGRLYNPADYPPEVASLFSVEWDFPAIEPPSYLMRLAPEIYRQEQTRVAMKFEEAVTLAEEAFVTEFGRLVTHLCERLSDNGSGERRIFRDSCVDNLTQFFERFRRLSIQSNAELDDLVAHVNRLVSGVTPQSLRDNDQLRQHVAAQMASVQTQLEGFLVNRPRRQIVRTNRARNGAAHATHD